MFTVLKRLAVMALLSASGTLEVPGRSLDVLHYDLQLNIQLENAGLFAPLNELQGRAVIRMKILQIRH